MALQPSSTIMSAEEVPSEWEGDPGTLGWTREKGRGGEETESMSKIFSSERV